MFDFLALPRELRDFVYRHALVAPGKLPIAGTYGLAICPCCAVDKRKSADVWDRHKRGCDLCHTADCEECKGPFYEIESGLLGKYEPGELAWRPNAALLLTCRDMFGETLPVLYGENDFTFQYTDFRGPTTYRHGFSVSIDGEDTAACFFQDRSLQTLQLIRTVSLLPADLDCQDLHMRELCFDFISMHMKVRTLAMTTSYFRVDVGNHPWQRIIPESMEDPDFFPMPISTKLAKSIRAFCKIKTLDQLILTIRMDYKTMIKPTLPTQPMEDIQAAAAFARLLQSKMLKDRPTPQGHKPEDAPDLTLTADGQSEVWHLHCGGSASNLGKLPTGTAGTQNSGVHRTSDGEETVAQELLCPICFADMQVGRAEGEEGRKLGPVSVIDKPELQTTAFADWPENLGDDEFLNHVGAVEDAEELGGPFSDAYESGDEEDTDGEETSEDEEGGSSEYDEDEDDDAAVEESRSGSEEISDDTIS